MRVSEIMTRNPVSCPADTPLETVAKLMAERDCGEIPIVDGDGTQRPVGRVRLARGVYRNRPHRSAQVMKLSGLQHSKLLIEGGDQLFEHRAMRGNGGHREVCHGASPGELQGPAAWILRRGRLLTTRSVLLLSLNGLTLPSSCHMLPPSSNSEISSGNSSVTRLRSIVGCLLELVGAD